MKNLPRIIVSTDGRLWSSNGKGYEVVENSPLLMSEDIPIITNDSLLITIEGKVYSCDSNSIVNEYGNRTYRSIIQLDDKVLLLSYDNELFSSKKLDKPICKNVTYIGTSKVIPTQLPDNHIIAHIDDEWKIVFVDDNSVTYSDFLGDTITGDYISRRNTIIRTTDGYWSLRRNRVRRIATFEGMTEVIDRPYNELNALNDDGELYVYANNEWIRDNSLVADRLNKMDKWVRLYLINSCLCLSNTGGELFELHRGNVVHINRYPVEALQVM